MDQVRLQQVRDALADASGRPAASITAATDLADDLHLDSLQRVEVALALEETTGIALEDGLIAAAGTVGALATQLEQGAFTPSVLPFPRWARTQPANLLRTGLQRMLVRPMLALLGPLTVTGEEQLADVAPPVLFIANHNSHLDTPLVLRALPAHHRRWVAVAAADDYFYANAAVGLAVSLLLNTFPFSRSAAVRQSFAYCGELMDAGWSLLVYPEGTRSLDGALQPLKIGIGLLAKGLHAPIVPIWLEGTHAALSKGQTWPRRSVFTVRIGEPITLAGEASASQVTRWLQRSLENLWDQGAQSERLEAERYGTPG